MKRVLVLAAFILLHNILSAQDHHTEQEVRVDGDTTINSLHQLFSKGKFFAHARSFVMATANKGVLSDYVAWGTGAGIGYESAVYKNLQFGVSGFFINNLASSDLTKRDPITNVPSRYELSLFEIENPENKHDLDRLEELFIRYHYKQSHLTYGKQYLNTPLINQQDGRMRPTMEKGLWAEVNEFRNLKIKAGWIDGISPRSTVRWYSVAKSIGLYSVGVNEDGTPSKFKDSISSKGIAITSIEWKKDQLLTVQAWNYWVQNLFNTSLLQADAAIPFQPESKNKLLLGVQYTRQSRVGNGGHNDAEKAYIQPGFRSDVFSSRLGVQLNTVSLTANYTRISEKGRFTFPREWGRDPFYTFLPRERNEGLGDVNAYVLMANYQPKLKNWQAMVAAGYYDLPHTTNYRLNKYGMPSYYQLLADVRYSLKGFMKGTSVRLIYLYKGNMEKGLTNQKNIIHKVNMQHVNFIVDYWFGKK